MATRAYATLSFDRIKVRNPVVEIDGDEMTRIIWKKIREEVRRVRLDTLGDLDRVLHTTFRKSQNTDTVLFYSSSCHMSMST